MAVTREYKDRLFTFIFGREENRAWTLSLYNAINNSNYTDPSLIEFTTIKTVLYLGMHNDVSFIIANQMNLYEQQSSYNPNMPLRQLQYVGHLFSQYIEKNNCFIYSEKIIALPVPKLVVFYNGRKEQADETWLRLSDSFPKGADADVEVKVRMLNIHYNRNKQLLEACKPLLEYSWLIDTIQANKATMANSEDAVNAALRDLPEQSVLKPFLVIHQAEVIGMLLEEYDEISTMNMLKQEAKAEGIKEGEKIGEKRGALRAILNFLQDGDITIQIAAKKLGLNEDKVKELLQHPELIERA